MRDAGGDDAQRDAGPVDLTQPKFDATPPPGKAVVYAHSKDVLYKVEPNTLVVSEIGPFTFSSKGGPITDIAIDENGNMVAVTETEIYTCDTETAACDYLADLGQGANDGFNGLSYVTREGLEGPEEVLVGANREGELWQINPQTGNGTLLGVYGDDWASSGDLVSVKGFGTVATLKKPGLESDYLARVNPNSGQATVIGPIGHKKVWGLGFWENKVYGFTDEGKFLLINVGTGVGTVQETNSFAWWGAGVTTEAKVIE